MFFKTIVFLGLFLGANLLGDVEAELVNCTNSYGSLSCAESSLNPYSIRFVRGDLAPLKNAFDSSKGSMGGEWKCSFRIGVLPVRKVSTKNEGLIKIVKPEEGFSVPSKFTVLGFFDDIKILPDFGHKCAEFPELVNPEKEASFIAEFKAEKEKIAQSKCACSYVDKGFFNSSGCKITEATNPGTACKCHRMSLLGFFNKCSSQVTACTYKESESCKNPTTDKDSCLEGQGDCNGY